MRLSKAKIKQLRQAIQEIKHERYLEEQERKKGRAHSRVSVAIHFGTLKRPKYCSMCGSERRYIAAHHENYNKPLVVVWLCGPCHSKEHARINLLAKRVTQVYSNPLFNGKPWLIDSVPKNGYKLVKKKKITTTVPSVLSRY